MPKYDGNIYESVGTSGPVKGDTVVVRGISVKLLGYIWPGEEIVLALIEFPSGEEEAVELPDVSKP